MCRRENPKSCSFSSIYLQFCQSEIEINYRGSGSLTSSALEITFLSFSQLDRRQKMQIECCSSQVAIIFPGCNLHTAHTTLRFSPHKIIKVVNFLDPLRLGATSEREISAKSRSLRVRSAKNTRQSPTLSGSRSFVVDFHSCFESEKSYKTTESDVTLRHPTQSSAALRARTSKSTD